MGANPHLWFGWLVALSDSIRATSSRIAANT